VDRRRWGYRRRRSRFSHHDKTTVSALKRCGYTDEPRTHCVERRSGCSRFSDLGLRERTDPPGSDRQRHDAQRQRNADEPENGFSCSCHD
jgi:hypothetical protein